MKFSAKVNSLAIGFALALVMIGYVYDKVVRVDVQSVCHTGTRYDKNGDVICPQFASAR